MKKGLLKLTSAVLMVLLLSAFAVPVYAESLETDDDSSAVVNVEPVDSSDGEELEPDDSTIPDDEEPGQETPASTSPEGEDEEENGGAPGDKKAGLPGMPEDFRLSSAQLQSKQEMTTSGEVEDLDEMVPGRDYVEDEIFFLAETLKEAETIAAAYGTEVVDYQFGVCVAKIPDKNDATVADMVRAAADTGNNLPVVSANVYRYAYDVEDEGQGSGALAVPNDPSYGSQWHHGVLGSEAAWATTMGNPNVVVAVLDTGLRLSHNDFAGKIVKSYDFVDGPNGNDNSNGHGSHVGGIVAGAANNGVAGAGVAPGARLMNIKVLSDDGYSKASSVTRGINAAVAEGVPIANLSLGGLWGTTSEKNAVLAALKAGTALIIAAGNDGSYLKSFPACYSSDVIVVASTDKDNRKSDFSTYGAWVDVAAPGSSIISVGIGNDTAIATKSGTSMATPVVSGVAALIVSKYANPNKPGDLNNDGKQNLTDVRLLEKMLKAATLPAQYNNNYGGGGDYVGGGYIGAGIVNSALAVAESAVQPKVSATLAGGTITGNVPSGLAKLVITAGVGDKIYYTDDGTTPSLTNGRLYTAATTLTGVGKKTIKAIAISPYGTVSKLTTKAFTLVQAATSIELASSSDITKGKSLQLKADVLPDNAKDKKVTWSLAAAAPADGSVKLTAAGKLTVTAAATVSSVDVVARASDGFGTTATFTINVRDGVYKVVGDPPKYLGIGKSVKLAATVYPLDTANKSVTWEVLSGGDYVELKGNTLKAVRLNGDAPTPVTVRATSVAKNTVVSDIYTITLVNDLITSIKLPQTLKLFTHKTTDPLDTTLVSYDFTTLADLINPGASLDSLKWTSNKPTVASVGATTGVVTARSKGTAKITVTATDGSGKKATCTVTVGIPVSSLSLAAMPSQSLAAGKSMTLKAVTNADATDKGMIWAIEQGEGKITLKNGKVTAKKDCGNETAIVSVTSKSNPHLKQTFTIHLKATASTKVELADPVNHKTITLLTRPGMLVPNTVLLAAQANGTETGVYWISSNPNVAAVNPATGEVTGKSAGKATITGTALDYSGKKVTSTVTVNIPASSLAISAGKAHNWPQLPVGVGTKIKFVPVLGTSHGKPTIKTLDWSIELDPGEETFPKTQQELAAISKYFTFNSKTSTLSVSSKIAGAPGFSMDDWAGVLVRGRTTDGSNLTATYRVTVEPKIKYIIAPKSGTFYAGYVYTGAFTSSSYYNEFSFTSSNADVAIVAQGIYLGQSFYPAPSLVGTPLPTKYKGVYMYAFTFRLITLKKGTTKITITANDGSGTKASYTMKVV